MKENKYYFLLGFVTAIFLVSCSTTLEADSFEACGSSEWNPCYVKVVE